MTTRDQSAEAVQVRTAMDALTKLVIERSAVGATVSFSEMRAIAEALPDGYAIANCNALAMPIMGNFGAQYVAGYFIDNQGNITTLEGSAGAASLGVPKVLPSAEGQFYIVKGSADDFAGSAFSMEASAGIGGVGFSIPQSGMNIRLAWDAAVAVASLDGAFSTDPQH